MSGGNEVDYYAKAGQQAWKNELAKTAPERADYWAKLRGQSHSHAGLKDTDPLVVVYSAGEYVVVDVAPDPRIHGKIPIGSVVMAVDGQPVHEYVKGHLGSTWLRHDPLRKVTYEEYLLFQVPGTSTNAGHGGSEDVLSDSGWRYADSWGTPAGT